MSNEKEINIFWFRRDLRLDDNTALYHALKDAGNVQCLFIFDQDILDDLKSKRDARVQFIYNTIKDIQSKLRELGSDLWVYHGKPQEVWNRIIEENKLGSVYFNRDYEPYARDRDSAIETLANKHGTSVHHYKDHVIFEHNEILKADGEPYIVFTPYKRKWMEKLESKKDGKEFYYFKTYDCESYYTNFTQCDSLSELPTLESMGFSTSDVAIPSKSVSQKLIKEYHDNRNFPAVQGTSRLGIHFRFGTISIREKAEKCINLSDTFLSELVWRDFYSQIMTHYPHVVNESFRRKYDNIEWRNNNIEFEKWCQGKTGYPIVDAGMRELNATGFMHNRVRMITASFLTKHLLIDWRWGEAYFAEKLLDYDLASNNGGWQWAAGSGTDAAPYFRIFNPWTQQEKFDKQKIYIKHWIPEYETDTYPDPIVDHKEARERCLKTYKEALNNA